MAATNTNASQVLSLKMIDQHAATIFTSQRKFRSLPSDKYGQFFKQSREAKSEDEKQRREVESEERRYKCAKVRKENTPARNLRKVVTCCVFFRGFVCRLGRKVGSLERRVRR